MDDILITIRSLLSTTPLRWNTLVQSVSADLLRRQPLEGEWSALECLQHLIDVEAVSRSRVKALLAGENFPAFSPATDGSPRSEASPPELAATFAQRRADNLTLIATLTPDDLARTAIHAELGVVSLSELLHNWAAHDLMHLVQAEQALMQPFIAGCKPWAGYYTKHVAAASADEH